jgi:glycosyltransferase involved in cell wall biosynthesis
MIIVNARFLTQKLTGVQRYAYEICKRLPTEINDHELTFVVPKARLINNLGTKHKVTTIGFNKGNLWEQLDLPLFLRKKGNPLLINFVGIAPVFYKNKIMFLYDLAFKHHPEWFSFKFHKTYNLFIPLSLKNSVLIITDSNYVKSDINKVYGILNEKIEVIYAAASSLFLKKSIQKEKIVLTVSSIDPRKNLDKVVQAFSQLNADYKLFIVGSKNKTFSNVGLPEADRKNNIIFTGYLSDEKLLELYNKAEIFIYASLFEGFGIPPLEAQSCGCPCIVSNVTSLPEVYGDSVEYCDPNSLKSIINAMENLINDVEKRDNLTKKGFDNISKYSWCLSTNELINLLEKI